MKKAISKILMVAMALSTAQCSSTKDNVAEQAEVKAPFLWENATVYFLLTDRFNNGTTENDLNFDRTGETRVHRNFMGGDIQGITQKIESGYFTDLGIDAIWLSPVAEQVHGSVDEGAGETYAFHGYWAKDWTAFEPNFGTEADIHQLVETAHKNNIRVLFDVVVNQRGPVTDKDPVWPEDWVRTSPKCTYDSYKAFIECTLVENLPDLRTDSEQEVEVPQVLQDKWAAEGRLESEMASLDEFFTTTGLKRTPRNYMIKWLVDYIKKFGIDGYRVDTVKHVEESVWGDLWKQAEKAFEDWKSQNPEKKWHDDPFYMLGEVYGYNIYGKQMYDFGDTLVNYFDEGFHSLINFSFKGDVHKGYEELFSTYSTYLNDSLDGKWIMNYLTSHDDSHSHDRDRMDPFTAGNKLLLTPGAAHLYYGDETGRVLQIEEEQGDAQLRSFMNWEELDSNIVRNGYKLQDLLAHYQKLGQFRHENPAVGAGVHAMVSQEPYVFSRTYKKGDYENKVVVGLDQQKGSKEVAVGSTFADGTVLTDVYSGATATVAQSKVVLDTPFDIVLLTE